MPLTVPTAGRSAIKYCSRCSRNAAKRVLPPSVERDVPEPLTITEARAFLQAIKGHRLQAFFHIAATSGPRPSEMLGLRWSSVDVKHRKVTIVEKLVTPRKSDGVPFTDPPKSRAGRRTFTRRGRPWRSSEAHRERQRLERGKAGDDGGGFCGSAAFPAPPPSPGAAPARGAGPPAGGGRPRRPPPGRGAPGFRWSGGRGVGGEAARGLGTGADTRI